MEAQPQQQELGGGPPQSFFAQQATGQPDQQAQATFTQSTPPELQHRNRQTILFKISSLTYPVDLVPLEASTRPKYSQTGSENHAKATFGTQMQPPTESPDKTGNFRALPRLSLLRIFAFVKQQVFLQEPISTCFSFLLKWGLNQMPLQDHELEETSEGFCLGPSQWQGAEVLPSSEVFANLTRELSSKNLIALCEVDSDFFGMIDTMHEMSKPAHGDQPAKYRCYLRLQVFQKHDKIPWQTDISTMLFTLIEQRSIKNSLFGIQKYMQMLPHYNEPHANSQRELWANQLASQLIQIRVQGKQSECRRKVQTAMEIAQVLYDVQFVAYLKKTFLEDANSMGKNGGGPGMAGPNGNNGNSNNGGGNPPPSHSPSAGGMMPPQQPSQQMQH